MLRRPERNVLWMSLSAIIAAWHCQPIFGETGYQGATAAQWTLYAFSGSTSTSGFLLTWNEASMFCKSLGGHLPALNSKLKMNAFNSMASKWIQNNNLKEDVWTGLYTPTRNKEPNTWEADCSLQQPGLTVWGPLEPDQLDKDFCVRYNKEDRTLRTWSCNTHMAVVCEFDKGTCRYVITNGSLSVGSLSSDHLSLPGADDCWARCMNYSAGQECVGAMFSLTTNFCTVYTGEALLSITSIVPDFLLSKYSMIKQCFDDSVNNCYSGYSFHNTNSTPSPAGDPCHNGSFTAVVPISTRTECLQTTTVRVTQQQTAKPSPEWTTTERPDAQSKTETTRLETEQLSSAEPQMEKAWMTTSEVPMRGGSSSVTSLSLSSGAPSTQSRRMLTTDIIVTTSPSQYDESTVEYINTSAQESAAPHPPGLQTTPFSNVPKYCPSTSRKSSTRDSRSLLCACVKFDLNISASATVVPYNTTSRYRRSRGSEWGSPSMLSSAFSAVFVVFTGLAGILFVACDAHRLACLSEKTRPKAGKTPAVLRLQV